VETLNPNELATVAVAAHLTGARSPRAQSVTRTQSQVLLDLISSTLQLDVEHAELLFNKREIVARIGDFTFRLAETKQPFAPELVFLAFRCSKCSTRHNDAQWIYRNALVRDIADVGASIVMHDRAVHLAAVAS